MVAAVILALEDADTSLENWFFVSAASSTERLFAVCGVAAEVVGFLLVETRLIAA